LYEAHKPLPASWSREERELAITYVHALVTTQSQYWWNDLPLPLKPGEFR
jgi:hypothetical protein